MKYLNIYAIFVLWVTFLLSMFDYLAFNNVKSSSVFKHFIIALFFPFVLIYTVVVIILGLDKDDK